MVGVVVSVSCATQARRKVFEGGQAILQELKAKISALAPDCMFQQYHKDVLLQHPSVANQVGFRKNTDVPWGPLDMNLSTWALSFWLQYTGSYPLNHEVASVI